MNAQQQMRLVLLYALKQLSGRAEKHTIMQYINDHEYWYINDGNDTRQYSRDKEKKWRNDLSYERIHLIQAGYMKPKIQRGLWEMTPLGESYLLELTRMAKNSVFTSQPRITSNLLRDIFLEQSEEAIADEQLIAQLSQRDRIIDPDRLTPLSDEPISKGTPRTSNGRNIYPRDPAVSERALMLAGYRCAVDPTHTSFLRRDGLCLYMEPHHLLPMSKTDYFGVSLDREQNVFSLCSNCHNQIHYGRKQDVRNLLSVLFHSREREICSILGREIGLDEIYGIYGVL